MINKKIGFIIEARMSSKRLPGKVLFKVNKKTILEYLILRLKKISTKYFAKIIVATTNNNADSKIFEICKKNKFLYFRGSEKNVLDRVYKAACKNKIDVIVRITSDCPLIDLGIIDQAIKIYLNNKTDMVTNAHVRSYPDGMDVEVFSKKILKKSIKFAKLNQKFQEHVTMALRKNLKSFKILNIIAPTEICYPKLGLTLDEKADFLLIKKIIKYFYRKKELEYSCSDIITLLKKKPELLKINNRVKRKNYIL